MQLFLEEEREKEMERLYDANLAESLNRTDAYDEDGADKAEASEVTKQTSETLMAGEKIMEALDIADDERITWRDFEAAKESLSPAQAALLPLPEPNALLKVMGEIMPEQHVLKVIERIPNASLHDALIVLPFRYVTSMLECLSIWAQKVRLRCHRSCLLARANPG